MPLIEECANPQQVQAAHDDFMVALNLKKDDLGPLYGGFAQMASDFLQGSANVFASKILSKKHRWFKMTDLGAIKGILRLLINPESVHIAQVTALGGGKFLVEHAKIVAASLGKGSVDLSTADEKLPGYYKTMGFEMVTTGAKTGEMVCVLKTL